MNPVLKILKALPKMRSMLVEYTESYKTRIVELVSYSNFFLRLILSKEKYTIPLLILSDRDILWNKNKYFFVCVHVCSCSVVSNSFVTTVDYIASQAPLSMRFSRQEYWSGLPFPPPRDLPRPGIKPMFPALAGGFFITVPPGEPKHFISSVKLKILIAIMEIVY